MRLYQIRNAELNYIIINDNLDSSFESLTSIAQAERLKRRRQVGLMNFVKKLGEKL